MPLLRKVAATDAIVVGDILPSLYFEETVLAKQVAHAFALVVAVFEEEPACAGEMSRSCIDDLADCIEAIRAGGECWGGFEAQVALREMRIIGSDIGWVRDNHFECPRAQWFIPVAFEEFDVGDAKPLCVGFGDGKCIGAGIGGEYMGVRTFTGDGERDGA